MRRVGQEEKIDRAAPLDSILWVRGITGSFGSRPGIGPIWDADLQEAGHIDLSQLTTPKVPWGGCMKFIAVTVMVLIVLFSSVRAEMAVRIGRPLITQTGQMVQIDVHLDNPSGMAIGGFDLLMTYDTSLAFQTVTMGQLLVDCGWEYFFFRAEGLNNLRIVAMADINNGPNYPSCYAAGSGILARLSFVVNTDPYIDYHFLSVQHIWFDCGDNSFSTISGDSLLLSQDVYAFDGINEYNITKDTLFPTIHGAPDVCMPNIRHVDFYNGGVYVILDDTVPPIAHCPPDIIAVAANGQCGATVTFEASVSDNSPEATIACDPPSGSFFPVGITTVTCIAADIFDNADTCVFDVTVNDIEPPQAICPNDTTVPCDPGDCGAVVLYDASASDNCPGAVISCDPPSTAFFPAGTTPATCLAVDASGNADTCIFNLTVIDSESPIISCPGDLVISNDPGQDGALVNYTISAGDNCTTVSIACDHASDSFYSAGITPVTCIASDIAGNSDTCVFAVTVEDTEPPSAICPDDITVTNEPGLCGARVNFSAGVTDNLPGATITCDPPSGALFPTRALDVICVAVDVAGNVDTCGFVLTVIDTLPPVLVVPEMILSANEFGLCGAIVDYQPTVIDNCANAAVVCNPPSGSYFPVGITPVTCIALDTWNNSDTADFPVIVADSTKPVLICPDDIEVFNDWGEYGAVVEFSPGAEDNCSDVTVTSSPPSGSLFEIGHTTVEVTATDMAGNIGQCHFYVTVILDDPDGDLVATWDDNCPEVYNPGQADRDGDDIGDACDWSYGDVNNDDQINVGDAVFLIAYVFAGGPGPDPVQAGDANCDGHCNVADAVFLINHVFRFGPAPDCP